MRHNPVLQKLRQGQPSIGTWLTLPDPVSARLMAHVGFDWLTVELEHAPVNIETAAQSFMTISATGTAPLARVPWNTPENIKRVLDNGAWGIVVPMVNDADAAAGAVRAARYQPLGERSVGGQLHALSFNTSPASYYANANAETLVVLMAEHIDAVHNIDKILEIEGIDVVFVGPNDLLNSMGRVPAFDSDDAEFIAAVEHVRVAAKRRNVPSGIHVIDPQQAERRINEGFQFIAIGSEAGMMLAKAQETARRLGLESRQTIARY